MPQQHHAAGQDWAPVNISKIGRASAPKTARQITAAKAAGTVSTQKRYGAGGNTSAHSATIMSARKLEEADEAGKIVKVDRSLSKAIQQARTAKKMTQKELGTAINEKPQVIGEYESGKAIPNPQIISKLEKKLGTKLPRPGKSSAPKKAGAGGKTGGPSQQKVQSLTRGGPAKRR